jgi:hypothetical protein
LFAGSIECLYGFHFDRKALHVDLDDHFKVGPNWGDYTGSWEDLKACAESLKAMVDRYKIFATKEELFTNDLTKIVKNFATIKTRLEPLPKLAKLSHRLAQFNPHARFFNPPTPLPPVLPTPLPPVLPTPDSGKLHSLCFVGEDLV